MRIIPPARRPAARLGHRACAGSIVGIAMGLRQVMGLYLKPMTTELGIGREPFSSAMAIANLIWGIGAVFAGMPSPTSYGAGRVVVGGALDHHGRPLPDVCGASRASIC